MQNTNCFSLIFTLFQHNCCFNCTFSFFFILYTSLIYFKTQNFFLKGGVYLISWGATKYDFLQGGEGGLANFRFFLTRGGGGKPISDFWLTRGVGRVWTPLLLADIICEQPLIVLLLSFFDSLYT